MNNELIIKKCSKCGATVRIIKDCSCENCGIKCCGEEMKNVVPNSVDAAIEKHVPTYNIIDNEIEIKVNHVMEKEHYIEWIAMIKDNKEYKIKLCPEQNAQVRFPYIKGATVYAYCNKHGLWKADVE